jgi:hypothetical protein
MANKPKKEPKKPTKRSDLIWCIIEATIGTIALFEGLVMLLLEHTFPYIFVSTIILYASAIKPFLRLVDNDYDADNKTPTEQTEDK